ncbi:hypothetical protein [Brucella anthropi]|uniref:hypothetical protein n=1 Tax=Brucella anthropi TaxID=529 RepID=UPI001CFE8B3B|nr:hypothetical protein [Brucella anthropi]
MSFLKPAYGSNVVAGSWPPPSGEAATHGEDRGGKSFLDRVTLGNQRPERFECIAVMKTQHFDGLVLRGRLLSLMRLVH